MLSSWLTVAVSVTFLPPVKPISLASVKVMEPLIVSPAVAAVGRTHIVFVPTDRVLPEDIGEVNDWSFAISKSPVTVIFAVTQTVVTLNDLATGFTFLQVEANAGTDGDETEMSRSVIPTFTTLEENSPHVASVTTS